MIPRRRTISQLKTQEMRDSILEQLEKAISLKDDGLILGSDAVMEMLTFEIEKIMTQFDGPEEKTENIQFNKSILPSRGKFLAENEKVVLRAVSNKDYEDYIKVSYECAIMRSAFKENSFKKDLWESFLSDAAANYSIFDKATEKYVGYCGIKNINVENWELVIELLKVYRYQGYGYHALVAMLNALTALTGKTIYRSRVDSDNYASQSLMRKIGAKPNGISEMLIHGEALHKFQEENQNLIDDKLRKLAKEFNVAPIDLIGHVLEFRIEWKETL